MPVSMDRLDQRRLLASISGIIYNDRNNNATYDVAPDIGWPDVTVYIDGNGNDAFDVGERSTVTAPFGTIQAGRYRFDNVGVTRHRVRVVLPVDFVQTAPTTENGTRVVAVTGEAIAYSGVNLGIRDLTQSSRLAGRVFNDTDGSGARNGSESSIPSVTVWSDTNDNAALDDDEPSTFTDQTGFFRLDVPNPGFTTTFRIRAKADGLTQTTPANNAPYLVTIDAGNGMTAQDLFGFRDLTPPSVVSAKYDADASPNQIRFNLSEPSTNTSWTVGFALSVRRAGATQSLPPGTFTLDTNTGGVLSYRVTSGTTLADGVYTATLAANTLRDAAGNVQTQAYAFQLKVLAGDATGDGSVNFDDLLVLAQNYGQTGRSFSQGNFNYSSDGKVDFDDLLLLAQRYGTTLVSAAAPVAQVAAQRATRRSSAGDVV